MRKLESAHYGRLVRCHLDADVPHDLSLMVTPPQQPRANLVQETVVLQYIGGTPGKHKLLLYNTTIVYNVGGGGTHNVMIMTFTVQLLAKY